MQKIIQLNPKTDQEWVDYLSFEMGLNVQCRYVPERIGKEMCFGYQYYRNGKPVLKQVSVYKENNDEDWVKIIDFDKLMEALSV